VSPKRLSLFACVINRWKGHAWHGLNRGFFSYIGPYFKVKKQVKFPKKGFCFEHPSMHFCIRLLLNSDFMVAGYRVVTHSPVMSAAHVQLSSLTQATIRLGWVKCGATSKQWVTAVEDCGNKYQAWLCPCWYKTCGWQVTLYIPLSTGVSVVGVAHKETP